MYSFQVLSKGIPRCVVLIALRLFSKTPIGGRIRPMEIHKMSFDIVVRTTENLGANNAEVPTSNTTSCWPGIFSNYFLQA